MVEGHVVEEMGKTWKLTLRAGLRSTTARPSLATKDCVASLHRWGKRDGSSASPCSMPTDALFEPPTRSSSFRLRKKAVPVAAGRVGHRSVPTLACGCPSGSPAWRPMTQISEVVGSGLTAVARGAHSRLSRNVISVTKVRARPGQGRASCWSEGGAFRRGELATPSDDGHGSGRDPERPEIRLGGSD